MIAIKQHIKTIKMKTKHTPGPWTVSHGANRFPSIGSSVTKTKICDCPSDMTGFEQVDTENKANARLIAAAPELLEALIYIAERYEEHAGYKTESITKAYATIKKATE